MKVHIPGAGDFAIEDMTQLSDPCPLPEKEKRRLAGKEKLIYSPMGDIGNLVYDGDAMYINIPDHQVSAFSFSGQFHRDSWSSSHPGPG